MGSCSTRVQASQCAWHSWLFRVFWKVLLRDSAWEQLLSTCLLQVAVVCTGQALPLLAHGCHSECSQIGVPVGP